jgi:hypothetical protein
MAKKKTSAAPAAPTTAKTVTNVHAQFPLVSPKEYLECRVLLEDQILLIDVRASGRYHSRNLHADEE